MESKVIPIREKTTLLTGETRKKSEEVLAPFTDKPGEAIQALEQAFCLWCVKKVGDWFTHIGKRVGRTIMEKVSNG